MKQFSQRAQRLSWEGDRTRQPEDYNEPGQAYKQALAMVKQDIEFTDIMVK